MSRQLVAVCSLALWIVDVLEVVAVPEMHAREVYVRQVPGRGTEAKRGRSPTCKSAVGEIFMTFGGRTSLQGNLPVQSCSCTAGLSSLRMGLTEQMVRWYLLVPSWAGSQSAQAARVCCSTAFACHQRPDVPSRRSRLVVGRRKRLNGHGEKTLRWK